MIYSMILLALIVSSESICTLTTNNHYYFVGFTSDGLVNIVQTRQTNIFKKYKECPDLAFLTSLCWMAPSNGTMPSNDTFIENIIPRVKRDTDFYFSLDPFF